ncbi:MAG TPA: hypothetical protein VHI13_06210 [Candidatus Kapabacteria bacterium]|nr:hypothetical protein [Candidatus Kapabacteria bacterium]
MKNLRTQWVRAVSLLILPFLLIAVERASAQHAHADSLLARAKREFKEAEAWTNESTPDAASDSILARYGAAETLLKQTLALEPANAEAHYFLGYTYDRIFTRRAGGSDGITTASLEQARTVTGEMRKALAADSHYRGEIAVLGPYDKITAAWGALALRYAKQGLADSARWAFAEGRRESGFPDAALELCRNILGSCPPDAIVLLNGDNDTFPLLYLQCVEGLRKDVTPVNLSLANAAWYVKMLKHGSTLGSAALRLGYGDAQLDTIQWRQVNDSLLPMQVPIAQAAAKRAGITDRDVLRHGRAMFILRTQQFGNYHMLSMADQVLIDLLRTNGWERPVCISTSVESGASLGLRAYSRWAGLVNLLVPTRQPAQPDDTQPINYSVMRALLMPGSAAGIPAPAWTRRLGFSAIRDTAIPCDSREQVVLTYLLLYDRLARFELTERDDRAQAAATLAEMERALPMATMMQSLPVVAELARMYVAVGNGARAEEYARAVVGMIDSIGSEQLAAAYPGLEISGLRTEMLHILHR